MGASAALCLSSSRPVPCSLLAMVLQPSCCQVRSVPGRGLCLELGGGGWGPSGPGPPAVLELLACPLESRKLPRKGTTSSAGW